MDFQLHSVPLLSRAVIDRADHLRADAGAGWADAAVLRVDARNQILATGGRAVLGAAREHSEAPPPDAVFLGVLGDGTHVWAVRGALPVPADADSEVAVLGLLQSGQLLDDASAQLVSSAVGLLNWHERARFSAADGSPTRPVRGGWARVDPATGREEFPRIDPAVICLVHDGADRAVLARQHSWPQSLFSLLAGFVEVGESFENCVAREIREEIGLDVSQVRYLGSQPWPFPRSLMVGFHAVGDPDQDFAFHDGEIIEAAWFTRAEIRAALQAGDWGSAPGSGLVLPSSISIARVIAESWVAAE